ncbi:hypothetical protein CRM22_007020 [Opisthorchis felineus]|uniref:Uncharacterized protein n=1 Tax=Opisthorchis felineus TaxID=147828 RepID=A0A4S2LIE4_OPIFE|nr:hypothetical protein CRM22_007020 [Opisthorchis felineus]
MFAGLVLVLLSVRFMFTNAISCLDDDGNPVEWFIGYKFPDGFEYAFLLPTVKSWRKSQYTIDKGGMMKNTYDAMYALSGKENSFYGMYNDEWPVLRSDHYWWGHMKGAFAFDVSHDGVWIIHSIPKLSEVNGSYQYPHTGRVYGQHLLCVSLSASSIPSLVNQLAVSRPLIQDSYIDPKLVADYGNLVSLFNHKRVTETVQAVADFGSVQGGLTMKHFSKALEYGKDLYTSLVAPTLGLGLSVETWQHGDKEPSVCNVTTPMVFNVQHLIFRELNLNFSTYYDHSKWAVTLQPTRLTKSTDMWLCLGDINRQYSQMRRGGGTMCIQNTDLWEAFDSLITRVEPCAVACATLSNHA